MSLADLDTMLVLYQVPVDKTADLRALARRSRRRSGPPALSPEFAHLSDLEMNASELLSLHSERVPGRLQSELYMLRQFERHANTTADVVELLRRRQARAEVFATEDPPRYRIILSESSLLRMPGGHQPDVQVDQIEHLLGLIKTYDRLEVYLLPFRARSTFVGTDFVVAQFDGDVPDFAYVEYPGGGVLVKTRRRLAMLVTRWNELQETTLSRDETTGILHQLADEHDARGSQEATTSDVLWVCCDHCDTLRRVPVITWGRTDAVPDAQEDPNAPPGVDLTRPNSARIYDYLLGGDANWSIDREFARQIVQRLPLAQTMVRANRMYLNRVVRHLTKRGVRQFLDIGAGVPTAGNTHQVADEITPHSRVVYVDNEPVAVAHAEILLNREGDPDRHAIINADLRQPDDLWAQALDTGILNPDEPIALLMIAVLHFVQPGPDGQDVSAQSVARFRELLPPESYLAISHLTDDGVPTDLVPQLIAIKQMYDNSASNQLIYRPRDEITALLGNFKLLDPGMAWTPRWHPEDAGPTAPSTPFPTPSHAAVWAGVGQKRHNEMI